MVKEKDMGAEIGYQYLINLGETIYLLGGIPIKLSAPCLVTTSSPVNKGVLANRVPRPIFLAPASSLYTLSSSTMETD